jgi:hypothetical protein
MGPPAEKQMTDQDRDSCRGCDTSSVKVEEGVVAELILGIVVDVLRHVRMHRASARRFEQAAIDRDMLAVITSLSETPGEY